MTPWAQSRTTPVALEEVATELSHAETSEEALERLRLEVDELRASRERMMLAHDANRRRIERELHDGLQQELVALAVSAQLARAVVERDPAAAAERLDGIVLDTQRALESAARLAQRIYPPLLDAGGLGAALRAAALASGTRAEISVATGRLPPEVAGTLYFCWLDVLESAGEGHSATAAVDVNDGALTFEVGGSASAALSGEVLTRVRDRVETIGGRLTTQPGPRGLTSVGGWIPLSR